MKPPSQALVALLWDDANSFAPTRSVDASDERDMGQIHAYAPILTVGWILQSNDAGVTIACEYLGDQDFRGLTFVPRTLIRTITPIRLSAPSRRPRHGGGMGVSPPAPVPLASESD